MLNFQVVSARLEENFGGATSLLADIQANREGTPLQPMEAPIRRSQLLFLVNLDPFSQVALANDKRVSSGWITILPVDDMKFDNGIGLMMLSEPESLEPKCDVRVGVPPALFSDLISAVRGGRLPSHISVEARFPFAGVKWDTETKHHLDVSSVNVQIPIALESSAYRDALKPMQETVSLINTRVGWLIVLAGILAARALWLWHPL